MTSRSKILAGAALAALASTAAAAQAPSNLGEVRAAVAAATPAPPDSARFAAALAAASELVTTGRVKEAMRSFRTVAVEQRAAGDYPGEALRRLASLQYGVGQEFEAAGTLDELAAAAQEFGDPAARLQALFDAAIIYQQLKMKDKVPERVRQITMLLKSPAIDAQLRADIGARLVKG